MKRKTFIAKILFPSMVINNFWFLPTSENPLGFSVWCVLAKFSAKPRNYS